MVVLSMPRAILAAIFCLSLTFGAVWPAAATDEIVDGDEVETLVDTYDDGVETLVDTYDTDGVETLVDTYDDDGMETLVDTYDDDAETLGDELEADEAKVAEEEREDAADGIAGIDVNPPDNVEAEVADDLSDSGPTTPVARAQRDDVEDLYVTANKREESLQEVPISMAALNADFLEESGITQFSQLAEYVPNLTINPVTDSRGTVVRIRGIGSPGTNAGIDPSVGVFIDGVYQGRAGMSVGDLLDIERVEVLRGPQGTLYGKNTAAGLINVISKRPSYEYEAIIESIFGNYDNVEGRASVNIPIVDEHIAARLSAYGVTRDGFDKRLTTAGRTFEPISNKPDPLAPPGYAVEDGRVNDAGKWGTKGRLLFDVDENLSFLVSGDYSREDTKCCVADIIKYDGFPTLSKELTFQNLASLMVPGRPFPLFSGTGIPLPEVDEFDRVVGANQEPKNVVSIGGVSLDGAYELPEIRFIGGSTVSMIGSWRTYSSDSQFDGDFSYYDAVLAYTNVDLNQYSAELRLTSPGGELVDYQTGFYFYHQDMDTVDRNGFEWDFVKLFPAGAGPTMNIGDNNHKTYSYAGFGQVTVNPIEKLSVTGGVRITHEKKTRVGTQTSRVWQLIGGEWVYNEPSMDAPPIIGPDVSKDEERSVTNWSGMANIRYFPTEDIMVYGSFATGFKSGGFNQLRTLDDPNVPSEFGDEESMNFEAGFKTSWFERMLTFNLTGFYTDYDNFQAQLFDGSSINVVNAGSLHSYGIEADLVLVPLPDLIIGTSMGWNVARYTDFKNGEETSAQRWEETSGIPLSCNGGATAEFDCVQDLTGKRLENAPVWNVSSFMQYEYHPPRLLDMTLFVRGEYSFMSNRFLAQDLDPNLYQDSTHIVNLRAGFRLEPDSWWLNGALEVTGWMRNVGNEKWNVVGFDVPTLNGYAGINAPPRQYGITTRLSF